jgi:photosystem II Psb28-2 protein
MDVPIQPSIEFFEGVKEELSDVRLRRDRATGKRNILMIFETLKSLEKFRSYTSRFAKGILLTDEEGKISLEPSSIQFIYGGEEGEELRRVECKVEVERDDHWERLMRFMHRYADANGMAYQDKNSDQTE